MLVVSTGPEVQRAATFQTLPNMSSSSLEINPIGDSLKDINMSIQKPRDICHYRVGMCDNDDEIGERRAVVWLQSIDV